MKASIATSIGVVWSHSGHKCNSHNPEDEKMQPRRKRNDDEPVGSVLVEGGSV
ncbi:unnamed protein product [Amoebophrya sp. A25]|nr:unnamed protein product [Amoebophrya sp. A25]|eukprot:GSA25T00028086001.1